MNSGSSLEVDFVEEKSAKLFITAILITHNGQTWLPEVIASLYSQNRKVDRIIAVDTGSTDASAEILRRAGITFISAEPDIGYGDAIEIALDHAPAVDRSKESSTDPLEWLWLIHDDCAPKSDALSLLVDAVIDRPQVVIAGPKLLGWYDRDHLLEVGISMAGNGARWTGLEYREQDQGQHDFTKEVLAVSTAAMLVRRDAFEELGGLDPNLALFRDDVDLGWRAHVAGFGVICVGGATAFHAEAAATERRRVDVSEAFLHRPLLLDRRNAAYVLLANSSLWLLPWVAIQILGTSVMRAIFDLLAKLPGYAADEIVAVGLLLINPADVIKARRHRKKTRFLSPSIIRKFIPARGAQISSGFDGLLSLISKKTRFTGVTESGLEPSTQTHLVQFGIDVQPSVVETARSYSDIGVISPDFDEPEYAVSTKESPMRGLVKRPDLLIFGLLLTLSLLAGRHRLGALSGGAMGTLPSSAVDLLRSYGSSWHLTGMGSGVASPTWLPILALASILTLGNLHLFVSVLFFLTPSASFLIFTYSLRKLGITKSVASLGGIIYVLTPVLWSSLNQGRIDLLILYLIAPTLFFVNPFLLDISKSSWRAIFSTLLFVGVIGSFSPLLLGLWCIFQLGALLFDGAVVIKSLRNENDSPVGGWLEFLESGRPRSVLHRLSMIVGLFFLELPWSLGLILHPTQLLIAPGIPISSGSVSPGLSAIKTALNNPGNVGSPPLLLISPIVIFIIIGWLMPSLKKVSAIVSAILIVAIACNSLDIDGHGAHAQVWIGTAFVAIPILLIPAILKEAERISATVRGRRFGYVQIGLISSVILTGLSALIMAIWIVIGSQQTLVHSDQPSVIPAFVSALETTPARPKTLVLSGGNNALSQVPSYYLSRGAPLYLGDADVATPLPAGLESAVIQLETGSGTGSSASVTAGNILGRYGIQYLFAKSPVSASLSRTIDGVGGFTRMSATGNGIVWRITGAYPRVMLQTSSKRNYLIPSANIGGTGIVPASGIIYLAEKYDTHWKLLINGNPAPVSQTDFGTASFNVSKPGTITILYDGTIHRGLLSLQLLTLMLVIVMVLPSGRRRQELPLEELL
jgi:GT2 family glycosyltransferase